MGVLTFLIDMVLLLGALCVLVASTVLAVEVLAAVWPGEHRGDDRETRGPTGRVVVLVPAHNEASGIVATLKHISETLPAGGRILVVADNCSDDTAALAAQAGAEVLERHDLALRGKGYALDFGVRHLAQGVESDLPDVVIVVDADCTPAPGSLAAVAAMALARNQPVQGLYLLKSPKGALQPYLKIATIATRLKNLVRPLGLTRLGMPCQLMGTGMAYPWDIISKLHLHTGHLVEDLVLGLECAARRTPPQFCPSALFTSNFPTNQDAQKSQRSRWETGHISIITRDVPSLLRKAVVERNWGLLALVVDVAVPPIALLAILMLGSVMAGLALWLSGGSSTPFTLSLLSIAILSMAILSARHLLINDEMSLSDLLLAPAYVVSKIVLYFAITVGRKVEWVRTMRD